MLRKGDKFPKLSITLQCLVLLSNLFRRHELEHTIDGRRCAGAAVFARAVCAGAPL